MGGIVDELQVPVAAYSNDAQGVPASAKPSAPEKAAAAPAVDPELAAKIERNFKLVRSVGEECQSEQELRNLLAKKPNFVLYDGFEPSGRLHIAQGVFKAINVNKCTAAGGTFIFWVADWFALMNDKMGGDLEKIQVVGQYLVEVWKAVGMDMKNVQFKWSEKEICENAEAYWGQALDIARLFTVARIRKCGQIMGRQENSLTAAQILYPLMQCADIFFLKADICQLGVDQRKVNMLARDYCDAANKKLKPIIVSHHMIYGLKAGQEKMSKSDPDSAIFMEDTAEDVRRKIMNAACPLVASNDGSVDPESMHLVADPLKNPCLDYVRHIIFGKPDATFTAGGVTYQTADDVKDALIGGKLSETDVKEGLILAINEMLDPVRKHFNECKEARDLLAKVQEFKKLAPPESVLRRARVFADKKVHAVFAPLPSERITMHDLIALKRRIELTPAGLTPVLWLEDWSAFTLNCFSGNRAAINNYYTLLVEGLTAIDPELVKGLEVVKQSNVILEDPNNYWISVIHAGRKFQVREVEEYLSSPLEYASQVVTSLMHIADVLALSPVSISSDRTHTGLHKMSAKYFAQLGLPELDVVEMVEDKLALQEEGDVDAINVTLLDSDAIMNPKLKKAFCEPGNVAFNPPLQWAEVFMRSGATLAISRKPENGGDVVYSSVDELKAHFASGDLHPGDLKPAVQKLFVGLMTKVRAHIKANKAAAAAQKDFENFLKKSKKAKK